MIPYAGLSFTSFERLKRFMTHNPILSPIFCTQKTKKDTANNITNITSSISSTHKYYELDVVGKLICGALTGIIAQTVTYPLDVVRRHMQLVTMITDSATRQLVFLKQSIK